MLVLLGVDELVQRAHARRALQQRRLHVVREAERHHLRAQLLVWRVAVQNLHSIMNATMPQDIPVIHK